MDYLSTWPEIKGAEFAILPIGSIEQHGLHLPVGTDTLIAKSIAEKLASHFPKSYLLPPLPFSSSFEHIKFPGSVSLKVPTVYAIISDLIYSLENSDIFKCVLVTGHMGNHLLHNIVQELNAEKPRLLLVPSTKQLQNAYQASKLSSNINDDMHAGEGETSLIAYLHPQCVKYKKMADVNQPYRPLLEVMGMSYYSDIGSIGFPSQASPEKGKALLDSLVNEILPVVKEFVSLGRP